MHPFLPGLECELLDRFDLVVDVLFEQGDVLADHADLLLHISALVFLYFIEMLTCDKIAGLAKQLVHGVELLFLQSGFGKELLLLVKVLALFQLILPVVQRERAECGRNIKCQAIIERIHI